MPPSPAKSDAFLVALDLSGRACLVVGSGDEATRRATALRACGAVVHVVCGAPSEELKRLAERGEISLSVRGFDAADLEGVWLAVLTDRNAELAATIASVADARRTFFCAVDQPEVGSYSHVALVRSGPVTLGISTNGRAPALARRLREELERLFSSAGLGSFAARLGELRDETRSEDRARVLGEAVRDVRIDGSLELPGPGRTNPH